jgi:hypothetical protein
MNNASTESPYEFKAHVDRGYSLVFLSFLKEETDNTGLLIIQSGVKMYVKLPDDGYFIAFAGNEFPKDLGVKPVVHGVDGVTKQRTIILFRQ